MFRFLAVIAIFLTVLAPQAIAREARTALLAQIGDWQVVRYVLNSGKWSCQAINSRGVYTGGVMIYMMAKGQSRGYLSYHNGFDMPYGSKAKLQIGNKTFTLLVDDKKNLRSHWPTSGRDLMNMERAMLQLAASKGNRKMFVTDRHGTTYGFSATKMDQVIKLVNETCGKK